MPPTLYLEKWCIQTAHANQPGKCPSIFLSKMDYECNFHKCIFIFDNQAAQLLWVEKVFV